MDESRPMCESAELSKLFELSWGESNYKPLHEKLPLCEFISWLGECPHLRLSKNKLTAGYLIPESDTLCLSVELRAYVVSRVAKGSSRSFAQGWNFFLFDL